MMKHFRKEKLGAAPGTLIHTGNGPTMRATVNQISFNENSFDETHDIDPLQIDMSSDKVHWIEVIGVHDASLVEKVGQQLGLHPLYQEDVMNIHQRPKVDDWGEGIFVVLRALQLENNAIKDDQVSIFVRKNLVVTFYESPMPIFSQIKERLCSKKGIVRKQGADFLAYAIIDTVIDYYFLLLQKVDDLVEHLEGQVVTSNLNAHLREIHDVQRIVVYLRKSIWPVREVINHLLRDEENGLLSPTTRFYLKDVYDHAVQVIETLDLLRDLSKGLLDVTISSMSHRLNEVIKILTIVSTLFVPLTFISSFYGMNFVNMPELDWKWGYPVTISLMVLVALVMLRYFRKKRWI